MASKKLTINVDIASVYSYFLFTEIKPLLPRLAALNVHVTIVPVFLGGIFKATQNVPPWTNEARGAYLKQDFRRSAERLGLSIVFPDNFMALANDLVPLRALHAIKARCSTAAYHDAIAALFTAFWTPPNANLNDVNTLEAVLSTVDGLTKAQVKDAIEAIETPEIKQQVREATEMVVRQGAFGAPWIIAERDGKMECFFGSDRLSHVYQFLNLPFSDISLGEPARL
ncbi:hypothetical protein BROUX41_002457 [Berkeleyomyces rouxiae]|uniref:uncharacterized protein n=1 Tax=Berkeleyomyces rouxiae TaxID=2035830 RepID=UPI003B82BE9A